MFRPVKVKPEELKLLNENLLEEAQLNLNFAFLAISSCIIATLGLLVNSPAVIIGAMIIAPLMMPLRGLALGTLNGNRHLITQSLFTLGLGTIISIIISAILGKFFNLPALSFGSEILARTQPNLADLGVAIVAGGVSGFAKIRPKVSDALAGTAIAVALMPPLCVVGISLSQYELHAASGAFLLYLTNFLGITLACMIVFVLGGYFGEHRQMRKALFWFTALIGLIIVPLLLSLISLIRQAQIKATLKEILQRETITIGQKAELIDLNIKWRFNPWSQVPLKLIITIRSGEEITSKQVQEVEKFLTQRLHQAFKVTLRVIPYKEIESPSSS